MTATAIQEYRDLLVENLPKAIGTEQENEQAIQQLESLLDKPKRTKAEAEFIKLLTVLIEDFEEQHYPIAKKATPIDVLRELMTVNGLKQKDLTSVFGTPSIVSEIMHGKRGLTIEHVRKLSERFTVSPEVFF
jgi:HTH-type transcriptional regulator / antitoxin HigA